MEEYARSSRRESRRADDEFGGLQWQEAVDMALGSGYLDVVPEVDRYAAQVADEIITQRMATTFEPTYDVAGGVVDIGRYLAGDPECMMLSSLIPISRAGRAVRLVVPVGHRQGITSDLILRRGAAVMALATLLQRAQHPLEIWAAPSCSSEDKPKVRLTYMVKVQAADESLDMGRVMFAVAHPSMLRRLAWSLRETESQEVRDRFGVSLMGGYGQTPRNVYERDLPEHDGTSIILDPLEDSIATWNTDERIVKWLNTTLDSILSETI